MASRVALVLKNLPAYAGDAKKRWVRSLGQEDPLDEEMATHSRILAWKIIWTEEPGGLQSMGLQRVGHDCTYCPPPTPPHHLQIFPPSLGAAGFLLLVVSGVCVCSLQHCLYCQAILI